MKTRMASTARAEGYALGAIFAERPQANHAAFQALADVILHGDASALVVPSLLHLSGLGWPPTTAREHIQRYLNAAVLTCGTEFGRSS